jgi:hypothetical protein
MIFLKRTKNGWIVDDDKGDEYIFKTWCEVINFLCKKEFNGCAFGTLNEECRHQS